MLVKLKASEKRLILEGVARHVLWERLETDWVHTLIWVRRGISTPYHSTVACEDSSGIVQVEVEDPLKVFRQQSVIVANSDGTWEPETIWVGVQLTTVK